MNNLTNLNHEITNNTSSSENTSSTNSVESGGLANSDKIAIGVGVPSAIIALITLVFTILAVCYAKREFIDKRKAKRKAEEDRRKKELRNRMKQGNKKTADDYETEAQEL